MDFFSAVLALFLVINAFGNAPVFLALVGHFSESDQRRIIKRELLIALGVLIFFGLFGALFLRLFGITNAILSIGGGILLFVIALGLIFHTPTEKKISSIEDEPFIVPLAVPLFAGPGTISTAIIYSEQIENIFIRLAIMVMAWGASAVIILFATKLKEQLGPRGLLALQKLGGMLVCLLAVKMICVGGSSLLRATFDLPHKEIVDAR